MSPPFLFAHLKFPYSAVSGWGLGSRVIPSLSPRAQSIQNSIQSTSSRKESGSPIRLSLPYHRRFSCVRVGIIDFRQTRSLVAPSNLHARLYSNGRLGHTERKATKAEMLRRWKTWSRYSSFRRKQIKRRFNLRRVLSIFNEILFHGGLGSRVVLTWAAPTGKPDWPSRIAIVDAKQGPRLSIEVMEPLAKGPWTNAIMQDRLEALLYAMTKVSFLMNRCNCVHFQPSDDPAVHGQRSDKCSSWNKKLRDVERKANRMLKGLPNQWNLRRR